MDSHENGFPSARLGGAPGSRAASLQPETIALILRIGLGLVLMSGGASKLSQLLDPGRQDAIIAEYWGPTGYVNAFFDQYLFGSALGQVLTPWTFLMALSTFELLAGILLVVGLLVRPLALAWGFMFWTFLAALPVATAAGIGPELITYRSPALLILIRDIGLSGMFFMLFIIGAGSYSVDRRWIGDEATRSSLNWDQGGLLVRLSVAFPLLVGGAFHGEASIQTFGMPSWMLLLIAIPLILNVGARWAGVATVLVIAWFIASSFDASRSLIANMNAAKREYAFLAASVVLGFCGGGRLFSIRSGREGLKRLLRPGRTVGNSGAIGAKA